LVGPAGAAFARRRDKASGEVNEVRDDSGGRDDDTVIREHLANERTLLSWVRTGVGLISIGLVVERAGALVDAAPVKVASTSASELFGLALALLGVLTLVIGTVQFLRTRQRISSGEFVPSAAAYLIIVAGSLAFAGAFIVYVLFA
jgi:putative membrane protein